jgi:hypothetical protein
MYSIFLILINAYICLAKHQHRWIQGIRTARKRRTTIRITNTDFNTGI